jgi:selenocysteine-specific elongation factor
MQVIATAGHVDHGKSTLVRALTGMEPDRWAEERRRGMTIDLGFAWMTLPGGQRLAFVDVPGHERFVPNMLAGLGPVPAVLFVVAADGGWMPQSAEHLAAIDAQGVRHGLLVVTRADVADPGPALSRATAELAATSLGAVEALAVSAVTGAGLPELRDALARLAAAMEAPDAARPVRIWLDRSFTIKGAGTVVTGTLPAGTVRTGAELLLTPSLLPVRVRSVQALGEPAEAVTGVARVALNLRGVPPDVPERGMALVQAGRWTMTSQVDVRLDEGLAGLPERLPAEPLAHIGSARTPARLRVLGGGAPGGGAPGGGAPGGGAPGGSAAGAAVFARLTLRDPLPLHVGDRLLLRDPGTASGGRGAADTAGGGGRGALILGATVLDVAPAPLRRRGGSAVAARELTAWPAVPAAPDLLRRHGFLRADVLTAMGVTPDSALVVRDTGDPWLADPERWAALRARLPVVVREFLARDPLARGMPAEAARAALGLPSRDLVTALAADGAAPVGPGAPRGSGVVIDGGYLRPAGGAGPAGTGSGVALPPRVAAAVRQVLEDLAQDQFAAPDGQRLRQLGLDAKALATAARAGLLLRVADQVVLAPGADAVAVAILARLPQPFTTSVARQALGTSRRVVIPLLEYLDRARATERLPGDLRRVRGAGQSPSRGA